MDNKKAELFFAFPSYGHRQAPLCGKCEQFTPCKRELSSLVLTQEVLAVS